jgi:hypothetical protein
MKQKALVVVSVLFLIALVHISAGFSGALTTDLPYYNEYAEAVSGRPGYVGVLPAGERVSVMGCFDIKTDLFFEIADSTGRVIFVETLPITPTRELFPDSISQFLAFLRHPLTSANCWSLVPRMSQMAARQAKRHTDGPAKPSP